MARAYQKKIAKILRSSEATICEFEEKMGKATGRFGVLEKIMADNERLVGEKLQFLGVPQGAEAQEVYDALISKVEADDVELLEIIGHASLRGYEASKKVCDFVARVHKPVEGFFIKKEKAIDFLKAEPPPTIMKAMGYKSVDQLLAKEDFFEVYSALRFLEEREWQNNIFFKQYEKLTPADFEKREVVVRPLCEKWAKAAEKFVAKKYHNVSHLKELGVVFVIPIFLGISGETLRMTSLLFHYLHEIRYYSDVFKKYFAKDERNFAANIVSALRGDVLERKLPKSDRQNFLVVQRYLAKDDENDWRLFEPRINPEALHWWRAEKEIVELNDFDFWEGLGWVGDFFHHQNGDEALVSFDLVDTVMALVKRKELIKYLYHHQEALWNKIFIDYFNVSQLEKRSKENLVTGYFEV